MPTRTRQRNNVVYNTPTIRNGGFGYLQVEAIHNRPLSIARRHLAASELRMRGIEPNELSSSEWVRFLVMDTQERERWITVFERRRRNSNESNASSSSAEADRETAQDKAEEARLEAEEAAAEERRALMPPSAPSVVPTSSTAPEPPPSLTTGRAPSVSIWARAFDGSNEGGEYSAARPRHVRRAVTDGIIEAPPTYETAVRARTPPPAYEPRSDDEGPGSTVSPRQD